MALSHGTTMQTNFCSIFRTCPRVTLGIAAAAASTLLWTAPAAAQSSGCDQWTQQLTSLPWPGHRTGYAMASDPWRGGILLFGGATSGNDTWLWNGLTWSAVATAVVPAARSGHRMAYDPVRRRIVLFGGLPAGASTASPHLSDTWEWDSGSWNGTQWTGGSWIQRLPATIPTARRDYGLAYDSQGQRVVLFGGRIRTGGAGERFGDMWAWNGLDWTQLVPAHLPSARFSPLMVTDEVRGTIVLAGGRTSSGSSTPSSSDTWQWDGTDWALVNSTPAPAETGSHAMGFDRNAGRILLASTTGSSLTTHALRNGAWQLYSNGTLPNFFNESEMAFDDVSQRMLMYGTWSPSLELHLFWDSCCDDAEMPTDGAGNPVYPPDVDPAGIVDDPNYTISQPVTTRFPGVNTMLDDWVDDLPCQPSVGGTMSPADHDPAWMSPTTGVLTYGPIEDLTSLYPDNPANPPNLAAIQANLAGVSADVIQNSMVSWGNSIAAATTPPQLNTVTANNPAPVPQTPHCTPVGEDFVFGGADIVFVHGLRIDPLCDAVFNRVGPNNEPLGQWAQAGWQLPSSVPGTGSNPQFYGTGYWKAGAERYWQEHINHFLTSRNKKNRYLIVAYPSTQRLEVGVQAILTQIGDAMRSGIGVVDPLNPGSAPVDFGTPGFVIVSHSTGGPASCIAMSAAHNNPALQAGWISDRCLTHVALQGAFGGSPWATAAVAVSGFGSIVNPGWGCDLAELGILALNNYTDLNLYNINCPINWALVGNSILVDLVPNVMHQRWGSFMDAQPPHLKTLTVGGGHPTFLAPFKDLMQLGCDDGVVNLNSQFANPNLIPGSPSRPASPMGYLPEPSLLNAKVADWGIPLGRKLGLFIDQVVDNKLNTDFRSNHPTGVASGPVAALGPTGMRQPVDFVYGDHYDPTDHRPGYYSLILSTADHFLGVIGSPKYPNTWPDYRPTGLVRSRNWEEVSVRRDADLYTTRTNASYPSFSYQLVNAPASTVYEERGRKITFPRLFRFLPQPKPRWIWKRSYVLLADAQNKHQCDYVYEWVLPGRLNPCPQSLARWTSYGIGCGINGALLSVALNNPVLGTTWTAQLSNMPLSIGLYAYGFAQFNPGIALDFLGMPGCPLYTSVDTMFLLAGAAGTVTWNLPVPNLPAFAGVHVYIQGAAISPENTFGWITSNGLDLTLGF